MKNSVRLVAIGLTTDTKEKFKNHSFVKQFRLEECLVLETYQEIEQWIRGLTKTDKPVIVLFDTASYSQSWFASLRERSDNVLSILYHGQVRYMAGHHQQKIGRLVFDLNNDLGVINELTTEKVNRCDSTFILGNKTLV